MTDLNAKVGNNVKVKGCTGGDRLIQFCQHRNMVIANTLLCFKKKLKILCRQDTMK